MGVTGTDEHRGKAPKVVRAAIVTVSDTRTEADDASGRAIAELLAKEGHEILRKAIVPDDVQAIQSMLRELIEDPTVQAIVMNGGTGVSRRDVTLEAVSHFQEKSLPGFGELFRMLSYQDIGSAAMMSRAVAFVSERQVVFCLPGSERAVRLAISKIIAPELGHVVWEANR